jgi:radical SAM superfamily enzyme YgiQ (UPF0313 family)
VVELAREIKARSPGCAVFVGGHSASFTADELLEHAGGAVDAVLKGEGELAAPLFLEAVAHGRAALREVPGAVTPLGSGPPHRREVAYQIRLPQPPAGKVTSRELYVHEPARVHRHTDRATEQFVAATR